MALTRQNDQKEEKKKWTLNSRNGVLLGCKAVTVAGDSWGVLIL